MNANANTVLLLFLVAGCSAEKVGSNPQNTGDSGSPDADADADADVDVDDTGSPSTVEPLEGVGSTITRASLTMNCAPPTVTDPLMGSFDFEIDNASTRNFELDFSAFLTIDASGASPVASRINLSPNRWVVESRTTVNLTLEKTGGFVADSPCSLCGKTLDIDFAATAADGSAAATRYSTSVECTY